MEYIDTHCHLHDPEFFLPEAAEKALAASVKSGVKTMIGIGTSLADSKQAIAFAGRHQKHYRASVGIHPHEASKLTERAIAAHLRQLEELAQDSAVVAVGECGLDFYYNDRVVNLKKQQQLLRGQLEIAQKHNLPVSFHVREAFDDFWPILGEFKRITGVLHSFTDVQKHLEEGMQRGLYIGVNGIASFTSHKWQRELFKTIPLENLLLETDSPFLTPVPKRGTINTPENVIYITKYLAELRGEDESTIANTTSANARTLFGLS